MNIRASRQDARSALHRAPPSPQPQAQVDLKPMMRITWERGPDLPQGFQDSAGGLLGDWLITACGFQSGNDKGTRPWKYPRGFLNKAWALDTSSGSGRCSGNDACGGDGQWVRLPDFPGEPRQGLLAVACGDTFFCWGGFNYTEPCCYRDGYRLSRTGDRWEWSPLPPLPWMLTFSGICSIGSRIYVLGGHDYDNKEPRVGDAEGAGMHTLTDRTGQIERMGSRLLVLDAGNSDAGWTHLAECPGTPRGGTAMAAVGGKIYVLGGVVGALKAEGNDPTTDAAPASTCSCVDNWTYDSSADTWSRIRDLPVSSGGFPPGDIVFEERYILLVGGFQFGGILKPDGTMRPDYGQASRHQGKGTYFSDIFVYDTRTDLFGTASNLPMNNFFPTTLVRGDLIHLMGGETGGSTLDGVYYAHHPDLYLRGRMEELSWE